jgi:hypothetical protein
MGEIVEFNQNPNANIFMIDNISTILVRGYNLEQYISNDWQFAMIGRELVQFRNLTRVENQLYRISDFIRGESSTDEFINDHPIGEDFVIIRCGVNIIPVSESLKGQTIFFKAANAEKSITYENRAAEPLKQYITTNELLGDELYIDWVTRLKNHEDWIVATNTVNIEFTIFITDNGQTYQYQTRENEIIIDISTLTLSDAYTVTILANIH